MIPITACFENPQLVVRVELRRLSMWRYVRLGEKLTDYKQTPLEGTMTTLGLKTRSDPQLGHHDGA